MWGQKGRFTLTIVKESIDGLNFSAQKKKKIVNELLKYYLLEIIDAKNKEFSLLIRSILAIFCYILKKMIQKKRA